MTALAAGADAGPLSWRLILSGAWEDSRLLRGMADFRLGIAPVGLSFRALALDRRPLNFDSERAWDDFIEKGSSAWALGLYHAGTGSRLLYGPVVESGLPARIRNPWGRAAPFAENRGPVSADLRSSAVVSMPAQAHLYLSSPAFDLFGASSLSPVSIRPFASAQIDAQGPARPAFSGGAEVSSRAGAFLLEGFFTGFELPAKEPAAWFGDPPALPQRDFSLGAVSLIFRSAYFSLAGDLARSRAFAFGEGHYGSVAAQIRPPLSGSARPGPWSLSLSFEGMGELFVGREGIAHGGGTRAAARVERRGPRASLFRAEASARAPLVGEPFDRSAANLSYRFAALSARADIPLLRLTRVALGAGRNAANQARVEDTAEASVGLSFRLPPMALPLALLPASARSGARPRVYPLGLVLSGALALKGDGFQGAGGEASPPALPFFPAGQEFASAKAAGELSWLPGIFQLRTKWQRHFRSGKDGIWEGSLSLSARFGKGRLSARVAWPEFPKKSLYTLSWRLEL